MNRTRWIIFTVVCVAVLGTFIFINKKNEVTFTGDASKIITEGPIADRVYGNAQQKVVLVEYGDFQCPACGAMYATVKEIKTTHKDKLTFIFRNLPLTTVHPNALAAAAVAEAAGQQGKFYEMHDKLYESQSAWSSASINDRSGLFEQYATQLGLNIDQYKKDIASAAITSKIDRDRATAKTFSANATPTFVLSGQKVAEDIATNPEALKKAVEEAISKIN